VNKSINALLTNSESTISLFSAGLQKQRPYKKMKPTKKTEVITNRRRWTVTINGHARQCYQGPRGFRCALSKESVRALGIEPEASSGYELINGNTILCQSGPDKGRAHVLDLPVIDGQRDEGDEAVTTYLDPLPEPDRPQLAPRPPRGLSRRYGALIRAARAIAPLLPEDHDLRRALAHVDSY
jgi:hypothetical protein